MPAETAVGATIGPVRVTVGVAPMKVFSLLMADPNPIHFDPEFVRSIGLGDRPLNQGTLTMGYAVNAVLDWAGGVERLRSFRCRFMANVLEGDELAVLGEVVAIEESEGTRIATLEVAVERQTGERALQGTAVVELRPEDRAAQTSAAAVL